MHASLSTPRAAPSAACVAGSSARTPGRLAQPVPRVFAAVVRSASGQDASQSIEQSKNIVSAPIQSPSVARRTVLGSLSTLALLPVFDPCGERGQARAEEGVESVPSLVPYENAKQRYSLSLPKGWTKKDKAGADALWENPDVKYNNVGVTVNPVRIADIKAFGTLEGVGKKLLDAERAKDNFLGIELVNQLERRCPGGAAIYEYEYELFNSYGHKRVLTAVTIASSKLYILNSQFRCGKETCPTSPEDARAIELLRSVALTLDVPSVQ